MKFISNNKFLLMYFSGVLLISIGFVMVNDIGTGLVSGGMFTIFYGAVGSLLKATYEPNR